MNMQEKLQLIKQGKLTAEQNIKNFLSAVAKDDKKGRKINAFLQVNYNALLEAKEVDRRIKQGRAGRLAGLAIAVKSNINVLGLNASCASKTLENYKAPYDATVIKKIKQEDGIIIGMTNCDEFACGSSGETSAFGPTRNPAASGLIPGGSSSGSAAAVSAGFCDLALGSDTGGSIRNPASHCGVIGVKPSYGAVSRYGLIDLSMSLDQIGTFASSVQGAELLFNVIKGKDEKDATSFDIAGNDDKDKNKNIRIGIVKNIDKLCQDKKILELVNQRIADLKEKNKIQVVDIDLKYLDLAIQTYYPLVYVEFFSATRKFDGRRFGKKIEQVAGPEVLRRILGGSEISKAEYRGLYYRRALKAKALIAKEFEKAFQKIDAVVMPSVPRLPHKLGSQISVEEMYSYDALTIPANLSGICGISIPVGKINNIPVGMQIMCAKGNDSLMFDVAKKF